MKKAPKTNYLQIDESFLDDLLKFEQKPRTYLFVNSLIIFPVKHIGKGIRHSTMSIVKKKEPVNKSDEIGVFGKRTKKRNWG